jgi:hypothetical protein
MEPLPALDQLLAHQGEYLDIGFSEYLRAITVQLEQESMRTFIAPFLQRVVSPFAQLLCQTGYAQDLIKIMTGTLRGFSVLTAEFPDNIAISSTPLSDAIRRLFADSMGEYVDGGADLAVLWRNLWSYGALAVLLALQIGPSNSADGVFALGVSRLDGSDRLGQLTLPPIVKEAAVVVGRLDVGQPNSQINWEVVGPITQSQVDLQSELRTDWLTPEQKPRPVIVAREILDQSTASLLTADTEALLGHIRRLLHDGVWRTENGAPLGREEDIQNDLEALEKELHPRSDRAVDPAAIQIFVTRLGKHAAEHAQQGAHDANQSQLEQRIAQLRTEVLDVVSNVNTGADADQAIDAIGALSTMIEWSSTDPPDDIDDAKWHAFINDAEGHPKRFLYRALGWIAEKNPGPLAAMSFGGTTYMTAQWMGWGSTATGAAGAIGSLRASVVCAVIGILSARFAPNESINQGPKIQDSN